ncbi:unnamed protein product [Phytomonas sp. Hart1]|nr:unnamed protein product [Phytomonas sp. Hart1]|eukprot:CCW69519.1 unnamed protein product [Phytomonas sp. isolate Hart1]
MVSSSSGDMQSARLCLQVLRTLHENEWVVLSRLSYLVEMIQTCDFTSVEVKNSSEGSLSTLAGTMPKTTHYDPGSESFLSDPPFIASEKPIDGEGFFYFTYPTLSRRNPQEDKGASSTICEAQNVKQIILDPTQRLQVDIETSNQTKALTLEQHEELFANIMILYKVHGMLVQEIENAVNRLISLQYEWKKANISNINKETDMLNRKITQFPYRACSLRSLSENLNKTIFTSPTHSRIGSKNEYEVQMQEELHPSQKSSYKLSTVLYEYNEDRPRVSSPLMEGNSAFLSDDSLSTRTISNSCSEHDPPQPSEGLNTSEVAEIILSLFTSDVLNLFIYEHVDYVMNYIHKAMPLVQRLAAASQQTMDVGPNSWIFPAPMRHKKPISRDELAGYEGFIKILRRALGPSGVPNDARVCSRSLLEVFSREDGPYNSRQGDCGVVRASKPPLGIPEGWRGFETFLGLLSAPLPSLRRIVYAMNCLLHSGVLDGGNHERFRHQLEEILPRMGRETNMVLDDLLQRDVEHVEALWGTPSWRSILESEWFHAFKHCEMARSEANRVQIGPVPECRGGSVLLHKGRLYERTNHDNHYVMLFLFSGWVCFGEELGPTSLRLRGSMPLETLRVLDVEDLPPLNFTNGFKLISPKIKDLTLFAKTPEEKRYWVEIIQDAIEQHTQCAASNRNEVNPTLRYYRRHHFKNRGNLSPKRGAGIPAMEEISSRRMVSPALPPFSNKSRLFQQREADAQRQTHLQPR